MGKAELNSAAPTPAMTVNRFLVSPATVWVSAATKQTKPNATSENQ